MAAGANATASRAIFHRTVHQFPGLPDVQEGQGELVDLVEDPGSQIPADPGAQVVAPQGVGDVQRDARQRQRQHDTEKAGHVLHRAGGGTQDIVDEIPLDELDTDIDDGHHAGQQGQQEQRQGIPAAKIPIVPQPEAAATVAFRTQGRAGQNAAAPIAVELPLPALHLPVDPGGKLRGALRDIGNPHHMPHGEAAEEPFLPILPGEQQPAVHLGRADDIRSLPQRDVPQDPAPFEYEQPFPRHGQVSIPEEPPFGRQVIGHTVPHLLRHDARKRFRPNGQGILQLHGTTPLFIEVVCTCMDCRPVHPLGRRPFCIGGFGRRRPSRFSLKELWTGP